MINIMAGVVNSTHYAEQVTGAKGARAEKYINKDYKRRVEQIRRIDQVKAISSLSNQSQQDSPQEFFKAEIMADDKGKNTILMLISSQGYRQINLEGTRVQDDEKIINPAKVKAAYFND